LAIRCFIEGRFGHGRATLARCMRRRQFLPFILMEDRSGWTPAQFGALCWAQSGSFFAASLFGAQFDGVSRQTGWTVRGWCSCLG